MTKCYDMKKVAILQSNYIPWKGYFDMIAAVDEFILYDDMQYTRRDWRNRNQIKTPQGAQWLTVPVQVKGKYHQKIRVTEIDGSD
ncbi:MAG: WbqC family protein, partial [Methylobacter sp.]|nr:WbqC family protein [Methylobacter sp.]